MKRKYLIKKDPAKEGQDNWIIMNTEQFLEWKKTPEGQLRYNNLGRLDACDEDDYIIYMECDEATRTSWKKDADHSRYNRCWKANSGIEVLSYNAMTFDDEDVNGEETLPDPSVNIEEEIIRAFESELFHKALSVLTDKERELLDYLYLSKKPISERALGKLYGISHVAITKRKEKIFEKIRTYFQISGYQF